MKKISMDRKLVASQQPWEPATVAKKFKVKVASVRQVMAALGKPGKPCRSRRKIEKELRRMQLGAG